MKLALTVHQFFPEYYTGTEVLTYETARELGLRGHDVLVWTARPTDGPSHVDEYEYKGVRVRRYNYDACSNGRVFCGLDYRNPEFKAIFSEYLKKERPDAVHFFHLITLSTDAVCAAREAGVPSFFTATDFWFMCPTYQLRLPQNGLCQGPSVLSLNCLRHLFEMFPATRRLPLIKRMNNIALAPLAFACSRGFMSHRRLPHSMGAVVRRPDHMKRTVNMFERVFIPTGLMYEKLIEFGIDREKAVRLPFGLNLDYITDEHRKKSHSDVIRFGFIGSLYEAKGAHVAIEAFSRLAKDAQAELRIYGDASHFPEYSAHLQALSAGEPRIRFMGTFPNNEIGAVLHEIDVLIVPSLWHENAPLVLASAQASRTPVIASNLAGLSETIVHGDNGLLFEKGDVAGLAYSMQRLMDDKVLLRRLAENSRTPMSIKSYVDALEASYSEAIGGKRSQAI